MDKAMFGNTFQTIPAAKQCYTLGCLIHLFGASMKKKKSVTVKILLNAARLLESLPFMEQGMGIYKVIATVLAGNCNNLQLFKDKYDVVNLRFICTLVKGKTKVLLQQVDA